MMTERLTLMPLRGEQMRALLEGTAPEGIRYDGEPLDTVLSVVLRTAISAMEANPARAEWFMLRLIVDTATNTAVGSACFKGCPDGAGFVEIGYGLGERWRGRGYAKEAVRALSYGAFEQPSVKGIVAQTERDNSASIGVLKACGFVADGVAENLLQYKLTKHALFVCPVCRGALAQTPTGFACARRHAFDRARQGYVNLLRKKPNTVYEDKTLFAARRRAFEAGFFDPLADAVRAWLPDTGTVLDAGCGEGSLLTRLCGPTLRGVGLDISREAVRMAATANKTVDWCVGDLCDIPLGNGTIDAVLNVLTPANFGEFARVLRAGGRLIKAVPNEDHLCEVRAASGTRKKESTQMETESALARRFAPVEARRVRYTVACDAFLAATVFAMTPMTVHAKRREIEAGGVTVDMTLLIGDKR